MEIKLHNLPPIAITLSEEQGRYSRNTCELSKKSKQISKFHLEQQEENMKEIYLKDITKDILINITKISFLWKEKKPKLGFKMKRVIIDQ